jgi:hypothetical protein
MFGAVLRFAIVGVIVVLASTAFFRWWDASRESAADRISDEESVLRARGEPCRKSVSDRAELGRIEIWYYGCTPYGPGLLQKSIGNEWYTFHDGRQVEHSVVDR